MNTLQGLIDAKLESMRAERAFTGLTLGDLIDQLEQVDERTTVQGLSGPHSYRGYYSDLSFDGTDDLEAWQALAILRACVGRTFEGYKGGDYVMDRSTPVWSAPWGECGSRIVGLTTKGWEVTIETAPESN